MFFLGALLPFRSPLKGGPHRRPAISTTAYLCFYNFVAGLSSPIFCNAILPLLLSLTYLPAFQAVATDCSSSQCGRLCLNCRITGTRGWKHPRNIRGRSRLRCFQNPSGRSCSLLSVLPRTITLTVSHFSDLLPWCVYDASTVGKISNATIYFTYAGRPFLSCFPRVNIP